MKDLPKTIYKEFLIFYIVYLGLFLVSLVLFCLDAWVRGDWKNSPCHSLRDQSL